MSVIVSPSDLSQARAELATMVRTYLFNPRYGVTLIDFGFPYYGSQRMDDRVALRFHVPRKLTPEELTQLERKMLPTRVGNFETDVVEGQYEIQMLPSGGIPTGISPLPNRPSSEPVLCGGMSISTLSNGTGTLGGIVRDRASGEVMILSNWHVLAGRQAAQPGQSIYQPGIIPGGALTRVVARFKRELLTTNLLDAATATLIDGSQWRNFQLGIGAVRGVGDARLGMKLTKYGATTGRTNGMVSGIEGYARMTYNNGTWDRLIDHVITISRWEDESVVSGGGDSGSWWLDAATNNVIALHFGGVQGGTRAQALDIQNVINQLGVDVAL